ncbi:MAG: DUF397 domain-containing protein [Streptosporangiaceae bacterium]
MARPVPSPAGWRTSSHSGANGSCIQVAARTAAIAVRDSKDPHSPELTFTARHWAAFTAALKSMAEVSGICPLSSHPVRGRPAAAPVTPGQDPAALSWLRLVRTSVAAVAPDVVFAVRMYGTRSLYPPRLVRKFSSYELRTNRSARRGALLTNPQS